MPTLPAWYPDQAESKPAPIPLLLVQAFLNTLDPDTQTDLLADPLEASDWFAAAGLLDGSSRTRPAELQRARMLRESIRGLITPGASGEIEPGTDPAPASELEPLRELARTHQPRLTVDDRGLLTLENPRHASLGDGLFDLLLIIKAAQEDGSWERLRACANPDCRWVFYDRSRNQQGSWCDMTVCGNRLKNRRLRARRR
jgi:predicted RNA-binding Zn ribbon-like protein